MTQQTFLNNLPENTEYDTKLVSFDVTNLYSNIDHHFFFIKKIFC